MKKLFKEKNEKIGILGGTFDPAHNGHIEISKIAKKKFKLDKIIWCITNQNPFKKKSNLSLLKRIKYAKKINLKNKFIKTKYFEKKIKSRKTIDLINFIKKYEKTNSLYFIMGADNLINFHKWHKWQEIFNECKILVFDRKGYKHRSMKSLTYKKFNKKGLVFISFKKVNISSSQLRKI